jgi:membrane protease YdiL (CAAX protease family)
MSEIFEKRFTLMKIVLLIEAVGIFSLSMLFILNLDNDEFPRLASDSLEFVILLVIGISLQIAVVYFDSHRVKVKDKIPETTLLLSFLTFIVTVVIQGVITLTLQPSVAQVSVVQVYAFFISAAIAEEAFFRGGVVGLTYVIAINNIHHKQKRIISILLSTLVGALTFTMLHVRYYAIPAALIITLLTGILLSIVYAINKNLLVTIIVHVAVNIFATGALVQTLMGPV